MHASRSGAAPRITALALVLLVLAAACGGEGEAGGPAPDAPFPAAEGEGEGEGGEELEGLSSMWATTPAKIVYRQEVEGNGPAAESTVTLSRRPPDAWRMDVEAEGATTTLLHAGGSSYLCGTSMGEPSCLRMDAPEQLPTAGPGPLAGLIADPDALAADIGRRTAGFGVTTGSDTIAGEEARCFRVESEGAEGRGTAEWCFAHDGLLLRLATLGGAPGDAAVGYRLEATSVQRDVPDEDFEPPFPTTELPQLEIPDVEMPEEEIPDGYVGSLTP